MKQDYMALLVVLYDKFGDELIDMGKTALENSLQGDKASKNEPPAEDKGHDCERFDASLLGEVADYSDAKAFEQDTLTKLQLGAMQVTTSGDVVGAVKDLILMAGEVRKFEEAQITVRTDIAARRDIAIANIKAQEAALLAYLEKSFDERRDNFQALFSIVDDALEKDNMQALALSLESIIKLADSSPFKDLQSIEATATALTNPDHEWDF